MCKTLGLLILNVKINFGSRVIIILTHFFKPTKYARMLEIEVFHKVLAIIVHLLFVYKEHV